MTRPHRRRGPRPRPELRCVCGNPVHRYWPHCSSCGRSLTWRDTNRVTGRDCRNCGWVLSPKFSWCPWCGIQAFEQGRSSPKPLKSAKGFRLGTPCDWDCGGEVQYPMSFCAWCGRDQTWNEDAKFEGDCPRCNRGVDDWMAYCPWCGNDATGRDLIPTALGKVARLLRVARVRDWGYRVLLRPGVSGVDPHYPKAIEIDQRYVIGKRRRDEIPWSMLVGLITHELGHSFLYHHWPWTRTLRFHQAFGEVYKAYRVRDDSWVDFQRSRVAITPVNHVSTYAARHPQEDFAETFRFYLTRRGRLRELFAEFGQKRKGVAVYEKFMALHDYLRYLRANR